MNLIGVVGEEREPDIVGFRHRAPDTAAINIADLEIFEIASFPTRLDGHVFLHPSPASASRSLPSPTRPRIKSGAKGRGESLHAQRFGEHNGLPRPVHNGIIQQLSAKGDGAETARTR